MNASDLILLLRRFQNVVLEGPPGTGKTHVVASVAAEWQRLTHRPLNASLAYSITLHPSTAYEDFVEGLRLQPQAPPAGTTTGAAGASGGPQAGAASSADQAPVWFYESFSGSGPSNFQLRDGFFVKVCRLAWKHPEQDFLVLLDEINRANVPKVLGDLLTVLEPSKRARWSAPPSGQKATDGWDLKNTTVVELPYSGRRFFVPGNVYVIGTMNTSDRSVGVLDSALRRRFAFARVEPLPQPEVRLVLERKLGGTPTEQQTWLSAVDPSLTVWDTLNQNLLRPLLGPDAVLGHSYFFDLLPSSLSVAQFSAQLLELAPTLKGGFWTQTGQGTGGSSKQVDFAVTGLPADLFQETFGIGLGETDATLDLMFQGGLQQCHFEKRESNGTWRINLTDGIRDVVADHVQANGRSWNFPLGRILTLLFTGSRTGVLLSHGPTELPLLQALSQHKAVTAANTGNGRSFGYLEPATVLAAAQNATPDVRALWQFALLPQVFDTLAHAGATDLFADSTARDAWLEQQQLDTATVELAKHALHDLYTHLSSIGLRIDVAGTGLGRVARVSTVSQQDATSTPTHAAVVTPAAQVTAAAPAEPDQNPVQPADSTVSGALHGDSASNVVSS